MIVFTVKRVLFAACLGIVVVWIIALNYQVKSDYLVVMFSSFIGAFLAFLFSFILNEYRVNSENKASKYKAKYIIDKISKFNEQLLEYINKNNNVSIEPSWVAVTRYEEFSPLPFIDIDSLIFLVDLGKEQSLNSIILVDKEYQSILSILERRNRHYSLYLELTEGYERKHLQSLTNNYTLDDLNLTADQLMVIIGRKLFMELETLTESLIKLTKNLEEDSKKALEEINKL